MEASPKFFVNSWKQGILDDFLDLHNLTVSAGNDTKKFSLDATAMFVYLFLRLHNNMLEGKASEEKNVELEAIHY